MKKGMGYNPSPREATERSRMRRKKEDEPPKRMYDKIREILKKEKLFKKSKK